MVVRELGLKKFSRYDFNSVDLVLYSVLSYVSYVYVPVIILLLELGRVNKSYLLKTDSFQPLTITIKNSCKSYRPGVP